MGPTVGGFLEYKILVGGFNPSEKYARQIGNLPQNRGEIRHNCYQRSMSTSQLVVWPVVLAQLSLQCELQQIKKHVKPPPSKIHGCFQK